MKIIVSNENEITLHSSLAHGVRKSGKSSRLVNIEGKVIPKIETADLHFVSLQNIWSQK